MDRRQLITGLATLAVSASPGRAAAQNHASIRLGAQTNAWAIDHAHFESFIDVLKQIRGVGYAGFETGFANIMPQAANASEARQRIQDVGLTFFGTHIYLSREKYDSSTHLPPASLYTTVAQAAAHLGAHHLIFSAEPVEDASQLGAKIAGLNEAGKFCKSVGLTLAYHNETTAESQSAESHFKTSELDALYQHTDPTLVSFLLDCGHAWQAGVDVPAFLHAHHARIIGLHLRDMLNGQQVVLGRGNFPLRESASVLKQAGWHGWVLNEEERLDGSKHGLEYIEPAFHATREAFL